MSFSEPCSRVSRGESQKDRLNSVLDSITSSTGDMPDTPSLARLAEGYYRWTKGHLQTKVKDHEGHREVFTEEDTFPT